MAGEEATEVTSTSRRLEPGSAILELEVDLVSGLQIESVTNGLWDHHLPLSPDSIGHTMSITLRVGTPSRP
jgi:hypothetical protein